MAPDLLEPQNWWAEPLWHPLLPHSWSEDCAQANRTPCDHPPPPTLTSFTWLLKVLCHTLPRVWGVLEHEPPHLLALPCFSASDSHGSLSLLPALTVQFAWAHCALNTGTSVNSTTPHSLQTLVLPPFPVPCPGIGPCVSFVNVWSLHPQLSRMVILSGFYLPVPCLGKVLWQKEHWSISIRAWGRSCLSLLKSKTCLNGCVV